MEPISPINKALIDKAKLNNNQTAKNVQVQTPAPKLSADSVEISTKTQKQGLIDKIKSNKKLLIAGGVAIAAATAGIIFGIKKGIIPFGVNAKAKNILKRSDEILAQGSDILAQGQKEYNEAIGLLTQARENGFSDVLDESGNVIRSFYIETKYPNLQESSMSEFLDGKIIRQVSFNQTKNGFDIGKIEKGIEVSSDARKISESFGFSKGVLYDYRKGIEEFADRRANVAESFWIDGPEIHYQKSYKRLLDHTYTVSESFYTADGNLKTYQKGINEQLDNGRKISETFMFSDGALAEHRKGTEISVDDSMNVAILNKYENGKLISHQKNVEL